MLSMLASASCLHLSGCGGSSTAAASSGAATDVTLTTPPTPAPAPTPAPSPAPSAVHALQYGVAISSLEGTPDALPGKLNGEVFVTPDTHFRYYADRNLDHLRIQAIWERMQPSLYGPLGEQLLDHYADPNNPLRNPVALVRRYLDLADRHGLKVILDLCHNYGGRTIGYDGDWSSKHWAALGSAELPIGAFADYCKRIAEEFHSHPAVAAIELMNEPHDLPNGETGWRKACQAAIDAIRSVDGSLDIVIDGYGWASAASWKGNNPTLHQLYDPADKLIWSAHQYFDANHTGTYSGGNESAPSDVAVGVNRLKPFTDWLTEHRFEGRGHVGEFGAPDTADWRPVIDRFTAAAKDAGLAMTAHMDSPYSASKYMMNLFPPTDSSGAIVGSDRYLVTLLKKLAS